MGEPVPRKAASLLSMAHQDRLKGWIHTFRKKTARLSTRITASLGLISLTRDEEFEKHYESFKHIEKTIRGFIKNLTTFVEHFESFLLSLQNTSENLSDFYRDKSYQKELEELRRKNKALACEHFHAFRRTVDRQVVNISNQLLQKFSGPHHLISKRSAKLLDYDNKSKEIESCRDEKKRSNLQEQFVIAKELYDRINRQLIEELPIFNRFALDIFRECILVLIEGRKNLIESYTQQTASLLETPLMMTYTASDVASSIFMSCDTDATSQVPRTKQINQINEFIEQECRGQGDISSEHETRQSSTNEDDISLRPHSVASQLSSDFDQMVIASRDICSTPLSQISESQNIEVTSNGNDEPDGHESSTPVKKKELNSRLGASPKPMKTNSAGELNSETHSNENNSFQKDKKRKKKYSIYIAEWPFVATGPNQLTISSNQQLKLIKSCDECGNFDWSLVQNKKGQFGYVPTSYIKVKDK